MDTPAADVSISKSEDFASVSYTANIDPSERGAVSKLNIRPEIDGLRAIAIVPVVLFHCGFGFSGGYVGVDVFFVISGFLITALIAADLSAGRFRLRDFWLRRIRRLFPALAVMSAACAAASWFLLDPDDLVLFGKALLAQAALSSNVFFWRSVNYFDPGDAQPLLHTWSLAVEEQFYLFFPFLLVLLTRAGTRIRLWTLSALAAFSFGLCVWMTHRNPAHAFYLLPFRAWELAIGGLLALCPDLTFSRRSFNEVASLLGFVAIGVAWFAFGETTPFPGVAAALPCLGAGLVIAANGRGLTLVGKVLAWRPLRFIGWTSYSWYLWHWPVLILLSYPLLEPFSAVARAVAMCGSFVIAAASWKYIETPFRRRVILKATPPLVAATVLVVGLFVAAGGFIFEYKGVPSRFTPAAMKVLDGRNAKDFRDELWLPQIRANQYVKLGAQGERKPINLLAWGDSHAMAILHVLDITCTNAGIGAIAATHSATVPLLHFPAFDVWSLGPDADEFAELVVHHVETQRIRNVLLAAAWFSYYERAPQKFAAAFTETFTRLEAAGAKVFVIQDVPAQPFNVPRLLGLNTHWGTVGAVRGITLSEYQRQNRSVNDFFSGFKRTHPSMTLVDPVPPLTLGDRTLLQIDGKPTYFDSHHLSTYGAMQLKGVVENAILRHLRSDPYQASGP